MIAAMPVLPVERVDEYERTLRALDQYRLLAAGDDGEILPATGTPVEPGEYYAGIPIGTGPGALAAPSLRSRPAGDRSEPAGVE